jgi:FSR family fosmidomycin resistance protein-like MFS transporter
MPKQTHQRAADPAPSAIPLAFQLPHVLSLSAAHFIHDVYSSFLSPLLPLLIDKLTLTLTQAGLLSTVMQIPALANPYIGQLADRISVRLFVVAAPAITAVPMSLLGLAPSYGVLLILLFVAGISVSLFHVPAPVMVVRVAGARTGLGMGFFMTGGELARTLGPLAAVAGVSLLGLEGFYPIMVFGLSASLWLAIRLRRVEAPNRGSATVPVSILQTWRELRYVLLPLAAILVARGFMHASMVTFLPTFMQMETGSLWLAGMALAVFEASGVAGALAAGTLSDRYGRRRALLASLLLAPIGLLVFTGSSGWLRGAALVLTGFTLLSTTPVMLALVQEHAGKSPSAANGFFMMISFLARSAVVVVVGYGGDLLGLQTSFVISAIAGLIAIPFVFRLPGR